MRLRYIKRTTDAYGYKTPLMASGGVGRFATADVRKCPRESHCTTPLPVAVVDTARLAVDAVTAQQHRAKKRLRGCESRRVVAQKKNTAWVWRSHLTLRKCIIQSSLTINACGASPLRRVHKKPRKWGQAFEIRHFMGAALQSGVRTHFKSKNPQIYGCCSCGGNRRKPTRGQGEIHCGTIFRSVPALPAVPEDQRAGERARA